MSYLLSVKDEVAQLYQALGRNQETIGRSGEEYDKEESDGPSDSPQAKRKPANSGEGDDDGDDLDDSPTEETGGTVSSKS